MPHYRVVIDAELVTKANSRDVVINRVRKMLREADFDVKDFEWTVEALKPKEADQLSEWLARRLDRRKELTPSPDHP